jgi:hypothetical protein
MLNKKKNPGIGNGTYLIYFAAWKGDEVSADVIQG